MFALAAGAAPDSGAILGNAWIMVVAAIASVGIVYYALGVLRREISYIFCYGEELQKQSDETL